MTCSYSCMMSARKYFPDRIVNDTPADVAADLLRTVRANTRDPNAAVVIDNMTDQIDVYVNNRKIAVYMFI